MSIKKKRIDAIAAIVAGSVVANDPSYSLVLGELNQVYRVHLVKPSGRRYLLQVLHSTRALDSTLKAFTSHYGCPPANSLGGYLHSLVNHNVSSLGKLSSGRRQQYQFSIVDRRNTYMHVAGALPSSEQEISILLSEMDSCLSLVLGL